MRECVNWGQHFMRSQPKLKKKQLWLQRNIHNCEYCSFTAMTDDRLTSHREQKHKVCVGKNWLMKCIFSSGVLSRRFDWQKSAQNAITDYIFTKTRLQTIRLVIGKLSNVYLQIYLCRFCKTTYESKFQQSKHLSVSLIIIFFQIPVACILG